MYKIILTCLLLMGCEYPVYYEFPRSVVLNMSSNKELNVMIWNGKNDPFIIYSKIGAVNDTIIVNVGDQIIAKALNTDSTDIIYCELFQLMLEEEMVKFHCSKNCDLSIALIAR